MKSTFSSPRRSCRYRLAPLLLGGLLTSLWAGGLAAQAASLPDGADEEAILMLEQGRDLARAGRAREALPFFEQTLDMAEAQLDRDSAPLAFLLHELASVYRDAGRPDRAESELRRSLGILDRVLSPGHRELLPVVVELANLLSEQARYAESEALYRRALGLLTQKPPPGAANPDPTTAAEIVATLGHLALLADIQGRADEAENLYRQSIELAGQHGHQSPELAAALNNLASIHHRRDEFDAAEPLYRRALELRRDLLGDHHWVVAVSLSDLALLLFRRGDHRAARELADQASALLEPYCGALNAEAEGVRRSARELCRDTKTLQQRLTKAVETPAPNSDLAGTAVPEPRPESVQIHSAQVHSSDPDRIFRVQLAARQDFDQAQRELGDFQQRFPELLGPLEARLEKADLADRGIWFRLQFGAFGSRREARDLCNALLQQGLADCWVADQSP